MLHRIDNLLALETILLLILAIFAGSAAADLHLQDAYYVIPLREALLALALGAGLLFLIYLFGLKVLRLHALSAVHIAGTLILLSAIEVLLYQSLNDSGAGAGGFRRILGRSEWILRLGYAVAFWQLLLPVNWLLSLRVKQHR